MIFFHQTQGKNSTSTKKSILIIILIPLIYYFENRFQGVQISKFSSMDVVIYNKIKAYIFNKGILCDLHIKEQKRNEHELPHEFWNGTRPFIIIVTSIYIYIYPYILTIICPVVCIASREASPFTTHPIRTSPFHQAHL